MDEKLNLVQDWDKTFPKSEKVEHHKVTFHNRYGITLAADLYQPKDAVLASPVYSANISAAMQALLERSAVITDMNREDGLFRHKVGAAVAAVRRGGGMQAVDAMNHFFLNHEMLVVGSTYWNMAYGQQPGDVQKDAEGLANMRNLGQNMAFLLEAVKREGAG